MSYKLINITKNNLISEHGQLADTAFKRMKGLLFRKSLEKSHALIFKPASSIHTFFMQFPIDIIFLDKDDKILKTCHNIPPFRLISCPLNAKAIIELPAGVINSANTQIGDKILFSN